MNKQMWNFVQRSRGILQLQPLGCRCNQSQLSCSGCEPGQYYECEVCGYLQPWCKSAEDSFFQICDRCRDVVEQVHGAVESPLEVKHSSTGCSVSRIAFHVTEFLASPQQANGGTREI